MIINKDKYIIGVDTGNFNVKTANFCFPSGITQVDLGYKMGECLEYNGKNYTLKNTPIEIMEDKTVDERFLIMTLFSIAKELLYNEETFLIDDPANVILAVGLPLSHYGDDEYNKNIENYYKKDFVFRYKGKDRKITIERVIIFPQGFPALYSSNSTLKMMEDGTLNTLTCPTNYFANNVSKALLVDIGGGTVDVISVINGVPTTDQYLSFNLGLYSCYAQIDNEIEKLRGTTLGNITITNYLTNAKTFLNEKEKQIIDNQINLYIDELISKLKRNKISLEDDYILLVGGGADVVYSILEQRGIARYLDILTDVKANAKGYESLIFRSMMDSE